MRTIRKLSECVQFVASELPKNGDRSLILIAGPSCSGKSFLLSKLKENLPELSSVGADLYFKDVDDPTLPLVNDRWPNYELPSSYRLRELSFDVSMLLSGWDIFLPNYDIRKNKILKGSGELLKTGKPVAVDFLHSIETLSGIDSRAIKVYVDTDKDVCLARRIKRDTEAYGISEGKVRDFFLNFVWPSFWPFAESQKNKADIILKI